MLKPLHDGIDDVARIIAAQRLGQDVVDPRRLHHGPDGTTRNHTGTGRRGLEHHASRSESTQNFVGQCAIDEGDSNQGLPGLVDTLSDRFGNFSCLPQPDADETVSITDDDQGAETESSSTFYDLRDTVDVNNPIREIEVIWIDLR